MNGEEQNNEKAASVHKGHRSRMVERLENGLDLQDHELLEILLYPVIPRRDTNPVAHELLNAFGSLSGVLHASVDELIRVSGVGKATANYLRTVALCYHRLGEYEKEPPTFFAPKPFSEYLVKCYEGSETETLGIFCIDKQKHVFFRKEFCEDKKDASAVPKREIASLLVMKKTAAVVAAHNHPSVSCTPSVQDDVFTKQLLMLCLLNGVELADHIIVGCDGTFSYRASDRLDAILHTLGDIRFN